MKLSKLLSDFAPENFSDIFGGLLYWLIKKRKTDLRDEITNHYIRNTSTVYLLLLGTIVAGFLIIILIV